MVSLGSSRSEMFIQVGSFSDPANAVRLSQRLARLGAVSVSSASVGGREYHRVRLGPVASVDEGDRLLTRLIAAGFPDARLIVAR